MAERTLRRRRKEAAYVRRYRGVRIARRPGAGTPTPTLTGADLERFIEEDRREEHLAMSWHHLANKSRLDQFAE